MASPAAATMMASVSPAGTSDPATVGPGEAWIVYQWGAGCGEEPVDPQAICFVRPDGTGAHPLPLPAGGEPTQVHPDWSPDGSRLAFERWMADGMVEIWAARPDGSDLARLVACDGTPCQQVFYPAWSPDGTKLAYARYDHPAGTDYEEDRLSLEVVDLATGVRRVVARAPTVVKGTYVEFVYPRWSRDATEIVFTRTHYGTPPEDPLLGSSIAVVKADGSEPDAPRILTDETLFGAYPDWSPTQDLIVFTTYDQGYFEQGTQPANLYTIRPDGSGLAQLTRFGEKDDRATQPTWTPDGKQVVFCHITYAPDGRFGSWGLRHAAFIDADGGNLTVLDGPFATHPRLRPVP
jgi:TolB protein